MFTYVNSEKTRIYFNTELRKVALYPAKNHPKVRLIKLYLGQLGGKSHEVDLGLYHISDDLLEGLSTIDEWAKDRNYITLDALRERLKVSYRSHPLNIVEKVEEVLDDKEDVVK